MKIDIAEIQQEFDRLNQCYYDRLEEDEDQMFRLVEELGENFDELYDLLISASDTCKITLLGNNYCILIYEADIDSFDGDLPQIEDLHIEPDFKKLEFTAYYNMEKISDSLCLYDEEYFFRSDAEALGKIVAYLLSGENQLFLIMEYGEQPKLPDLCAKNSEKINPGINWKKIFKFIDKVNDGYYDDEIEEEEDTIDVLENFKDLKFVCKKCPDLCSVHYKDLISEEENETLFTQANVEEEIFVFSLNYFLDEDSVQELKWHRTESEMNSISFDIICEEDNIEIENISINQTNHEYKYYDVVKALDLGSKSFVFIRGGDTPFKKDEYIRPNKSADIYFPDKNRKYTYGIKVKDLKVGDKVRVDGAMAGHIGIVKELYKTCSIERSFLKYVLEIIQ